MTHQGEQLRVLFDAIINPPHQLRTQMLNDGVELPYQQAKEFKCLYIDAVNTIIAEENEYHCRTYQPHFDEDFGLNAVRDGKIKAFWFVDKIGYCKALNLRYHKFDYKVNGRIFKHYIAYRDAKDEELAVMLADAIVACSNQKSNL